MDASMTVSLSPVLSQWAEDQAARRGFGSCGEFISDIIRREREKEIIRQRDQRVSGAMQSLVSEMTDANWDDIRKAGRAGSAGRRHQS